MNKNDNNRWLVAIAGVVIQIALGAVYAWSVFSKPLHTQFGWSIPQIAMTFEITILVLGFAAFAGGLWMKRVGPRVVGIVGGICYGVGTILAGRTGGNLTALYLTYGLIGGAGVGLGYIIPVATLIKWFPDKRGMITGIAVGGFGAGALMTAPIAARLIAGVGVANTFTILGVVYLIAVTGAAFFIKNPPEGYKPAGWEPSTEGQNQRSTKEYTLKEALSSWQWYALWSILFLNTTAGISIISQASPMAQEISKVTPVVAAGMVSIISIANGAGRFLWAWLSDFMGRRQVFLVMFILQAVLFVTLPHVQSFGALTALAFIVLLCYGGGFGTMPAFAADLFGSKDVGSIYGLMLTAWGFAGVVGPAVIASIREHTGHYDGALHLIAGVMLVSAIIPLLVKSPHDPKEKPHPPLPGQPTPRAA